MFTEVCLPIERRGAATAKPKPTESPSRQTGRRLGRRIISVPSLVTWSTYSLSPLLSTGHLRHRLDRSSPSISWEGKSIQGHSRKQRRAGREFPPTITSSGSSWLEGQSNCTAATSFEKQWCLFQSVLSRKIWTCDFSNMTADPSLRSKPDICTPPSPVATTIPTATWTWTCPK